MMPLSARARRCAQDRLRLRADGRVALRAEDGRGATARAQLVFEPLELLEKLAALTPRPRINLLLYHGVLAPHARWRARVVAYSRRRSRRRRPRARPPMRRTGLRRRQRPSLGVGGSHAARVRPRRAGVPALRRAPALARHHRGPEAIHAILAALAMSRGRADRAPPLARVAGHQPCAASERLSASDAGVCSLGPGRSNDPGQARS